MNFLFEPYKIAGKFEFGTPRTEGLKILGNPESELMYGYPVKERYMDDYGTFHVLYSKDEKFEAIELFPDISDEEMTLTFNGTEILLSDDIDEILEELKKITDDMTMDSDGEGYSSKKTGIRIYCPEESVEDVLIHALHYYG